MGERNNKLTPDIVQKLSALTDVRKISDLEEKKLYDVNSGEINTSNEFIGSYLVTSTFLNDRYYNFRIKLQELTNYIREIGGSEVISFKKAFEYFITQLKENTQNSYVQFTPVYGENAVGDEVFSYTFNYKLSEITTDIIPFDDSEYGTTYVYTDKLTDGLITSDVLEQYMRNTVGRILGVPNTPAAVSEAIDSIIEFVDWFKGFKAGDDYSSLLSIDETKTVTINGKILKLHQFETGIGLMFTNDPYTALSLSLTSPSSDTMHFERDSSGGTLSLGAKPSKLCTSRKWNDELSQAQTFNSTDTIDGSGRYSSNEEVTFTLSATEILSDTDISNGHTTASTKTLTVKTKFDLYRTWVFVSTDPNYTISINDKNYPVNLPNVVYDSATSSAPTINVNTGTSGYVYILIKNGWNSKDFYFGSNFPEQKNQIETYSLYTNSTNYILYRSVNSLNNVRFEYK